MGVLSSSSALFWVQLFFGEEVLLLDSLADRVLFSIFSLDELRPAVTCPRLIRLTV